MVFKNDDKLSVRTLSPSLQEKAEKEIHEKPERVQADIQALRDWLNKQPHLQSVKASDQWLLSFLRGCKFSLEKSKEKLDTYYTFRTLVPELFSDRDPSDQKIQEILKCGAYLPLPNAVKGTLTRGILVRYGAGDNRFHIIDLIKVSLMINEIMMMEDDHVTVCGEMCLVDLNNVGISLISQWTPSVAKKVIKCFEEALPIRMKGTLVFNTPFGFESAYNILKAVIGEKLRKRFQVFNKLSEEIYKSVPKASLPKEYDGDNGSIEELTEYWKNKVESYREWFIREESSHSDEQRRQKKSTHVIDVGSVEGSFRKLEVD